VKTVLVVDDEPTIRTLVNAILDDSGVRTLEAADGLEALDMARRHQPDLVLLDVVMPRMDGFAVCQRMKEERSMARTPVLLLTALVQESDRQRARRVGAEGIVQKPFSPAVLRATVEGILNGGKKSSSLL
jgi:two-component system phosphate regulon response regulator PhoB